MVVKKNVCRFRLFDQNRPKVKVKRHYACAVTIKQIFETSKHEEKQYPRLEYMFLYVN